MALLPLTGVHVWHCQKFSCNYFPLGHKNDTGCLDYYYSLERKNNPALNDTRYLDH